MVKKRSEKEKEAQEMPKSEIKEKKPSSLLKQKSFIIGCAAVIIIAILVLLIYGGVSKATAGKKAVDFLNDYFLQNEMPSGAELKDVKKVSGLYEVSIDYEEDVIIVYVTKDGKYIIPESALVPISEIQPSGTEQQQTRTIGNFLISKDEICKENNKPIIYLFGSNGCSHCRWEHPLLNNVTSKFEGYISYHDNIDTENDSEVFSKYSTGGIPTLVFGCRYYRVGSGESIGQEQETKVLTALICKLTGNKPSDVCNEVQDLIGQIGNSTNTSSSSSSGSSSGCPST